MKKKKTLLERRADFFYDLAKLIIYMKSLGYEFAPVDYFRDQETQRKLLEAGKTFTADSKHLVGLAIDLVYVKEGFPMWERCRAYEEAGKYWKALGHTWGGDWKTLNDIYHFEE